MCRSHRHNAGIEGRLQEGPIHCAVKYTEYCLIILESMEEVVKPGRLLSAY